MKDFAGKIAVVTGGGTGMGRELVRQLAAEGCNVAMCDVSAKNMAETQRLCEADGPPQGTKVTAHLADVSIEGQLKAFRDEVARDMDTDKIHLLFNNAGVGGGGSLFTDSRENWERTFNICWGGVYLGVRTFLPMLVKASEAHIINTSSVNGFYASIGPNTPHTAYSAAKFAVKGFTEALMTDLKVNAPHVKCSVVMPGHIGTEIVANSRKVISGTESDDYSAEDIKGMRLRVKAMGQDDSQLTDAQIAGFGKMMADGFRDNAPMTAAAASKVILDGVKAGTWRILVGEDAQRLDEFVRKDPAAAYDTDFFTLFPSTVGATS
ncbi:MAG: SDR family NAD(P)-dependent oxidoreductase [Alphaproteobacteria bacterium]|nr:SDR family NAD(P)-dependent oxidoreductase [Alphaproteobacteria bacterium]